MSGNTSHDRTVFSPTLLIGLGGTGSEVLLSVREEVKKHSQDILNRFLFIDTDIKSASAKKGYTKLQNSEICMIGSKAARSYNDSSNRDQYRGLMKRFPPEQLAPSYVSLLSQGTGAAQIRSLGALAFALDYANVRKKIEALVDELSMAQNKFTAKAEQRGVTIKSQSMVVYIVGSLAGGTGSGSFVDAAVVARDVIKDRIGWDCTVVGWFTLPDGYDSKVRTGEEMRKNIKVNTYAALMELQYLMDQEYDKIRFDYDTGTVIHLLDRERLYDNVYLVDNKNMSGTITLENIYDVVAKSIYQDIGTTFGASSRSLQINMAVFTKLTVDKKTGKPRLFSSIASSSLVYPARRVSEYCTNSSLSEVIFDKIIGGPEPLAKINREVSTFLSQHALEDRSREKNQIIEQLLQVDGEPPSYNEAGIYQNWQGKTDKSEIQRFLDQLSDEMGYLDGDLKHKLDRRAAENKQRILHGVEGSVPNKLELLVGEWAVNLAVKYNVSTAVKALKSLEDVSLAMGEELKTEIADWERESQNKQELISMLVSELEALRDKKIKWGDYKGNVSKKMSAVIEEFNSYVHEKQHSIVKGYAVEIVDALGSTAAELAAKWSNLVQILQEVQQDLEENALRVEASKSRNKTKTSKFATEIDITEPGYEAEYYKNHYIEPTDVYNAMIQLYCEKQNEPFSEGKFIAWLYDLARWSRADEEISRQLKNLVHERFWSGVLETNILEYIRKTRRSKEFLEEKLRMLFDMCAPFWQMGSHMLATTQMEEVFSLAAKYELNDENELVSPKEIDQWRKSYTHDGTNGEVINNDIPYSITLNRRVHGARAYFLAAVPKWETLYKNRLKQSKGRFMLHVHSAFTDIPLLMPTDSESVEAFAKGMALGFIVKRGDWYYFGIEEKYDIASNTDNMEIGYKGHWRTVHQLEGVPRVPERCGRLWFKLTAKNPPEDLKIGQGRESALNGLKSREEWLKKINDAFNEYYKNVGMDLREQLAKYVEDVLDPAARKATGTNKTLLESEKVAITEWAKNNA